MAHDARVLRCEHVARGEIVEVHLFRFEPFPVWVLGCERCLYLVVLDDPSERGVDEEHLPGLEPTLAHDLLRVDVEHADFRREDDKSVIGDPEPRRPETVAVEDRAGEPAIGEHDRGGTVPGFHECGVELVEGPPLGIHLGVVLPCFGDHHQHRVRQAAPTEMQKLEHLVERRRVAPFGVDDREQPFEVPRNHVRTQKGLARPHPIPVTPQRVDLPVVRDVPVRVRE